MVIRQPRLHQLDHPPICLTEEILRLLSGGAAQPRLDFQVGAVLLLEPLELCAVGELWRHGGEGREQARSVDVLRGQEGHEDGDQAGQDAGDAVQVVDAAGVVQVGGVQDELL